MDCCRVRVIARFRPQNPVERDQGGVPCVDVLNGDSVVVNATHHFTFDSVLPPAATQAEVYAAVAGAICTVTDGFNSTILAYGQTSSGKTHTMEGPLCGAGAEDAGIIPRTATAVVGALHQLGQPDWSIGLSMIEIYMERVRDLLGETMDTSGPGLAVHDDNDGGTSIPGLTEIAARSAEDIIAAARRGADRRARTATRMNTASSRSHTVVFLRVRRRDAATGRVVAGRLALVDLAGSEKVNKTMATGAALEEAKSINKSLSALGNVINALALSSSRERTSSAAVGEGHVPYRNSKLTRVLRNTIGGNARTVLVVTASSSSYNAEETISSLRFGQRAKFIRTKALVNELFPTYPVTTAPSAELAAEQRRVADLAAQLDDALAQGAKAHAEATVLATELGAADAEVATAARTAAALGVENEELYKRLARATMDRDTLAASLQASKELIVGLEAELDKARQLTRGDDLPTSMGPFEELQTWRERYGTLAAAHESLAAEHARALAALGDSFRAGGILRDIAAENTAARAIHGHGVKEAAARAGRRAFLASYLPAGATN